MVLKLLSVGVSIVLKSLVVFFLGLFVFYFNMVNASISEAKSLKREIDREVASTPEYKDLINQKNILVLECDLPQKLDYKYEFVRLVIPECLTGQEMRISNQSNSHMAEVFYGSGQEHTTDYIPLLEGENQILIQTAKAEHFFTVIR